MKLTKEELTKLETEKLILIITNSNFTYKGQIISFGEDYIKFLDKYDTQRFILLTEIKVIEVLG